MGITTGNPGQSGVVVTREVRWFFEGDVPEEIHAWFWTTTRPIEQERRLDTYDLEAAERRVGLKVRNSGFYDAKLLVSVMPDTELAPGMKGQIEDWMKVSEPAHEDRAHIFGPRIDVLKDIHTRRYLLGGSESSAGCEVELASISTGRARAWTVCFETFGPPELKERAFEFGVDVFNEESVLPEGFVFTANSSWSYPEWLSRCRAEKLVTPEG